MFKFYLNTKIFSFFSLQQMICCSILKALLTEYSTSSQSANIGLSLEFHAQCKKTFEVSNFVRLSIDKDDRQKDGLRC